MPPPLSTMRAGPTELYSFRLLLEGPPKVGKTTVIEQLVKLLVDNVCGLMVSLPVRCLATTGGGLASKFVIWQVRKRGWLTKIWIPIFGWAALG